MFEGGGEMSKDMMKVDEVLNSTHDQDKQKEVPKKFSYKEVMEESLTSCPSSAFFSSKIDRSTLDGIQSDQATANGDRLGDRGNSTSSVGGEKEEGKIPPHELKTLSLLPNEDMVRAIKIEKSQLKHVSVFFACLDKGFLPSRKFLMNG